MSFFKTRQDAGRYLLAHGYAEQESGRWTCRAMTQGSLCEPPYMRVHVAEIIYNRVDPIWQEPDYFTLSWL